MPTIQDVQFSYNEKKYWDGKDWLNRVPTNSKFFIQFDQPIVPEQVMNSIIFWTDSGASFPCIVVVGFLFMICFVVAEKNPLSMVLVEPTEQLLSKVTINRREKCWMIVASEKPLPYNTTVKVRIGPNVSHFFSLLFCFSLMILLLQIPAAEGPATSDHKVKYQFTTVGPFTASTPFSFFFPFFFFFFLNPFLLFAIQQNWKSPTRLWN
jgi:hypothetical protein